MILNHPSHYDFEEIINNAIIIDETKIDTSIVGLGSKVKVYDVEFDEEIEYSIVGSNEADAINGKISDRSPIGQALIGAKAGQELSIDVPSGTIKLKVLEVTRA